MSFFDFETGLSALAQGVDRRKDDRAALALKLKAKLKELRAAGLDVDFEDDVMADEAMNGSLDVIEIVAS